VSKIVLDASALLAILNAEAGAEKLTAHVLESAICSTVNLAEVQSKLVRQGMDPQYAWESAVSPVREAVPFTVEQARLAGDLASQTNSLGLSLGDRACLALAISNGAPVYTADRAWKDLKLGIRIHVFR
jgi:ribonuclease VapC